jgi:serine O-acetyltransferase
MGYALVKSIQDYKKYKARRGPLAKVLQKYARLRHLFWSVVTASDVDANATIGDRFMLPHPNGVIVHARAVIGDDCLFMQQVTIGQLADGAVPIIGSDVYVGAGAKILGGVAIGDHARIGANAVVLSDVPAHSTAVGVPARIRPRSSHSGLKAKGENKKGPNST